MALFLICLFQFFNDGNLLLKGFDEELDGAGDEVVAVHGVGQGLQVGVHLDQFAPQFHAKITD